MTNSVHYTPPPSNGEDSRDWRRARLKRHFTEMVRLATPAMATRLGVMGLGLVDTAIVGHYATKHLAWLNMANQSIIMLVFVAAIGLLTGAQVEVAKAFGAEKFRDCGQVWRRTLPFTALISVGVLLVCYPAYTWLSLMGIEGELRDEASKLIKIACYGLPFHMLFIQSTMLLEGVGRAGISVAVMAIANIVNLAADVILVYGIFLDAPLGATGAAWASTIVRLTMASCMIGYIWFAPSMRQYGVRDRVTAKWRDWAHQRRMGYANSISLLAEVAAFSAMVIFAGWISEVTVAAHGVTYSILGVPLMLAVGISVASSVRVGIASGRSDIRDARLAGLTGLGFGLAVTGLLGLLILFATNHIIYLFTDDRAVITLIITITGLLVFGVITDGLQMVAAGALRGLGETWWPTGIQIFAFNGVMLPACYYFSIAAGLGFQGLMIGMALGTGVSLSLLTMRFLWVTRKPARK